MKAKKRGKRQGLRARSKNARVRAPRIKVSEREELYSLRSQVRRAREIMEVNDPINARDIFGPPLDETQPVAPVMPPDGETPPADLLEDVYS